MSGDFKFSFRTDHVHIQLAPDFEVNSSHMAALWTELGAFCKDKNCWLVLCEGIKPTRQMDVLDAYESGVRLAEAGRGIRMACYWEQYTPDKLTSHFENVSTNRGVQVRFFLSQREAVEWLGIAAYEQKRKSVAPH